MFVVEQFGKLDKLGSITITCTILVANVKQQTYLFFGCAVAEHRKGSDKIIPIHIPMIAHVKGIEQLLGDLVRHFGHIGQNELRELTVPQYIFVASRARKCLTECFCVGGTKT